MKYNHSLTSLNANEDFLEKIYKSRDGKFLNYRIHIPEVIDLKKQYPLLLFFHGAGERGNDNKKQLIHGVKNILAYSKNSNTPTVIVAPQCPTEEQWVNTQWGADSHSMSEKPSSSMALTIELLQELQETLPIDTAKIYVSGLSMGGFGTWDIIQRKPETFAAAMPVCGGGDTDMANAIKHLPIWVFHGESDEVVKPTRSRDMVTALAKIGGKIKYTEYKGVGHASWDTAYSDKKALKWLLSIRKSGQQPTSNTIDDGTTGKIR